MTISGRDDKEKPQRASQRAEVVETKQEKPEKQKNEGDFSTLLEMTIEVLSRDDTIPCHPERSRGISPC